MRLRRRSCGARLAAAVLLLTMRPAPATADATFFLGSTSTPSARAARGVAIGAGLLFLGFEFEYSRTSEDEADAAPSLHTAMGNVLLQTPLAIAGLQPYVTTGAGLYRERLGDRGETSAGVNTGAGVKISLLGPLRARLDYRLFRLRGDALHETVHRLYAGLNVAF